MKSTYKITKYLLFWLFVQLVLYVIFSRSYVTLHSNRWYQMAI